MSWDPRFNKDVVSYGGRDQAVACNFQRQVSLSMSVVVATISGVILMLEQTDIISSTRNGSVNVTNATLIYIFSLLGTLCSHLAESEIQLRLY